MNFTIPDGLTELLQDFTVDVLRSRPTDLVEFGSKYFNNLLMSRKTPSSRLVSSSKIPTPEIEVDEYMAQNQTSDDVDETNNDDDDEEDDLPDMLTMPKPHYGGRRHSVAAEKYNPEEDNDTTLIVHEKSDDERDFLLNAVKNIFLFRSLEEKQVNDLINAFFKRMVEPDEVLIVQGDDGDNFYVIESGDYDIYVNKQKVGTYAGSGSFGELALMYNMPRAATIISKDGGKVWALDRSTFKRIVVKTAFERRKLYENLLENMPLFKTLNGYQRMSIADALYSKSFKKDDVIIKQGDTANCMYFLEEGTVRFYRKQNEETKEVKICNKGDYFGELALLTKKPRAATAIANGNDVKCAVLDVDAFERLLGPCLDIMKNNMTNYEATLKNVFGERFNINDL
jgi:cAMP-dependent protein kinase regulator